MTTVFEVSIWNFQELIKALVPTKCISRNFDFGDLRSGQFWDFTIIRQWGNVHMPFFSNVQVGTCYWSQDILKLGHCRWPACRFNPMTAPSGHSRSYDVTFVFCLLLFIERDRALGMVPMCFSCANASIDIQYDLLGPTRDLTWPWSEVKFWLWSFKVNMYIFRRVSHDDVKNTMMPKLCH